MFWSIDVLSEIMKDTLSGFLAAILADQVLKSLKKLRSREKKR